MPALAVLGNDPATLRRFVAAATLWSGADGHEELFLRLSPDGVSTPAYATGADQAAYCTVSPDAFDRFEVDAEVDALLDTADLLGWLDWLADDHATVSLDGDAGAAVADAVRIESGTATVRLPCTSGPDALGGIDTSLPGRFDGPRYLDGTGEPVPTRAETTAATLRRVLDAAERAGRSVYSLTVGDGRLVTAVETDGVTARARLEAHVEGPETTLTVGAGFARVVRALTGPVTLQTGPGEPLALVQTGEAATRRYLVTRV
jgi:hypothetical protein